MKFADQKLTTKIVLLLSFLGLVSISATVFVSMTMEKIDTTYSDIIDKPTKGALLLSKASRDIVFANRSIWDLIAQTTEEGNQLALNAIDGSKARFRESISEAMLKMPHLTEINQIRDEFTAAMDKCSATIEAGKSISFEDQAVARSMMEKDCDPALQEVQMHTTILVAHVVADNDILSDKAADMTHSLVTMTYILGFLGLTLLLGLVGFLTQTQIARPIAKICDALLELAKKNPKFVLASSAHHDEISTMEQALEHLQFKP